MGDSGLGLRVRSPPSRRGSKLLRWIVFVWCPAYPWDLFPEGPFLDGTALNIPRGHYARLMALATLAGLVVTWAVCGYLGGSGLTLRTALLVLGIGSVGTFAPAVLQIGREHWGVAVLFAGGARSLLVLALCYILTQNNAELQQAPLFQGAVAGAVVVMIAESAAAVSILSKLERRREELKRLAGSPASDRN